MVQDKKNFTGNKANDSKNLDNRKTQPHTQDRDSARPGMKDQNQSRDKERDIGSKRDVNSRK